MPIYEYECAKCGITFEMIQPISAKPLKTCSGIGCKNKADGKVRRLISASGFILKGSGWYSSDYPSEARKKGWEQENKAANPEPANSGASSSQGATPATVAPAATPEPKPVEKKTSPKNPYVAKKSGKTKTKTS